MTISPHTSCFIAAQLTDGRFDCVTVKSVRSVKTHRGCPRKKIQFVARLQADLSVSDSFPCLEPSPALNNQSSQCILRHPEALVQCSSHPSPLRSCQMPRLATPVPAASTASQRPCPIVQSTTQLRSLTFCFSLSMIASQLSVGA